MNIKHLKYFSCVAKHLSYTKAAHELFISQPTLCNSIYSLEKEYNIQLFKKKGRNIEITTDGKMLLVYAESLLEHYKHFEHRAYAITHPDRGKLSVGMPNGIAHYLLPEAFCEFCQLYPNVQVNLLTMGAYDVKARVENGSLDCGFTMGEISPSLISTNIIDEKLVLVAPYNSPISKSHSMKLNQLGNEKLILLGEDSVVYHILKDSFKEHDMTPNVIMTSSEIDFILDMVRYGYGCTIQSNFIVKRANTSDLVIIPLEEENLDWKIELVRQNKGSSSLSILFCDFIRDYCQSRSGIQ